MNPPKTLKLILSILAILSVVGFLSTKLEPALKSKLTGVASTLSTQDPAQKRSYAWPAAIAFEAPLDLPHINNYPAFARVGAQGKVAWKPQAMHVELTQISHAAQRNVWFDCSQLQAVRIGLTHDARYGARSSHPSDSRWSDWQEIAIARTGAPAYSQQGSWSFDVATEGLRDIWATRLALQVRCVVRGGKTFEHQTMNPLAWPAHAAHTLTLAPNPCTQTLRLAEAIGMRCEEALKARLATSWGQAEVRAMAYSNKDLQDDNASWLDLAIAEGMPQAIEPLIKAGVSPNVTSGDDAESALIYAAATAMRRVCVSCCA